MGLLTEGRDIGGALREGKDIVGALREGRGIEGAFVGRLGILNSIGGILNAVSGIDRLVGIEWPLTDIDAPVACRCMSSSHNETTPRSSSARRRFERVLQVRFLLLENQAFTWLVVIPPI